MANVYGYDVSVFTVNAASQLQIATDASLAVQNRTASVRTLGDTREELQAVKKAATLTINSMSDTGSAKVTALDVSALTIGGVNYLSYVEEFSLSVQNSFKAEEGLNDPWEVLGFTGQSLSGRAKLRVPATINRTAITKAYSTTMSDPIVTFSFTLNSITVTVSFIITDLSYGLATGDVQTVDVTFGSRAAVSAPAGTTTPLEKVLNAPGSSQALVLTTKSGTGGVDFAGNFVPSAYNLNVVLGQQIKETYTYMSTGAITEAATS